MAADDGGGGGDDPPGDPADVLLDNDDDGGSAGSTRPRRGVGIGGRVEGSDATDEFVGLWDGGGGTWALCSSPGFGV